MYNILICDDERDIVNALKIYLNDANYALFEAFDGREALKIVGERDIHLVLMDIMMPEMDGIEAMVKIRERSNVPVILLTAKSEDADKILGLTVGADDYITKPFNPVEVSARVRSQLRRYMQLGAGNVRQEVLRCGGIELDDTEKKVLLDGEEVALTPTEYEILKLLMQNPRQVLTKSLLLERISTDTPDCTESSLKIHVSNLRRKLRETGGRDYIESVWGIGYKMQEE